MFTNLVINRLLSSLSPTTYCRHVFRHRQLLAASVYPRRCLTGSSPADTHPVPVLDKRSVVSADTDGHTPRHLQDIDLNDKKLMELFGERKIDALAEPNTEILDEISPAIPMSFNLAAFANKSETIQMLIKLGVDLAYAEKRFPETAEWLLKLDFEADVKPYITFLVDNGVKPDALAHIFTRNLWLFAQHLDDLQIRINYLSSKKFDKQMIVEVITKAPLFLNKKTQFIDSQLALLQREYRLTANELRFLVTNYPKIALLHEMKFKKLRFIFKDEFGFNDNEIKLMVMESPMVFKKMIANEKAHRMGIKIFDYIHNEMQIPHELIARFPLIFERRLHLIDWRHKYLKSLGRNQYSPVKPLYVPLSAFYKVEDNEFCEKYAKTSVHEFNLYLKTI